MITDLDLCGALSNLLGDYADHDRMSLHQEAYAEQSREYLTLAIDRLKAIDALRPPCPTCGGTHRIRDVGVTGDWGEMDCPDCVDGKVSIEQLVATWRAVHDERRRFDGTTRDYLIRSVKP